MSMSINIFAKDPVNLLQGVSHAIILGYSQIRVITNEETSVFAESVIHHINRFKPSQMITLISTDTEVLPEFLKEEGIKLSISHVLYSVEDKDNVSNISWPYNGNIAKVLQMHQSTKELYKKLRPILEWTDTLQVTCLREDYDGAPVYIGNAVFNSMRSLDTKAFIRILTELVGKDVIYLGVTGKTCLDKEFPTEVDSLPEPIKYYYTYYSGTEPYIPTKEECNYPAIAHGYEKFKNTRNPSEFSIGFGLKELLKEYTPMDILTVVLMSHILKLQKVGK